MIAIAVLDLTRDYNSVRAVDGINFEVEQGEIFGYLGPNGAGKTTTIRMLTGQLRPTSGSARVMGCDVVADRQQLKPQIGVVFESQNLYERLSGRENLNFYARLYRVDKSRVNQVLNQIGLVNRAKDKVSTYSNGMKQRLLIGRALLHEPLVLFMDEPTRGLDPNIARDIRQIVAELAQAGMTIFLTTHQIEEANQLCDRVAIINHGQIAAVDTPERLKQAFRRVQSVEVALEPDGGAHGEPLSALSGVTTSVKMGDKWRLYTEDPSALLPQVMNYAHSHELRVVSLSTLGPSLEDVFLEITGQQVGTVRHETQKSTPRQRGMGGRR